MTVVCLFFFMAIANGFQTKEPLNKTPSKDNLRGSFIQQNSLIPLECDVPIDSSWLKRAKNGVVTGKVLQEPTVRVAYLIPSNRSPQAKGVEALQFIIRTGRDFFKDEMTYNGHTSKTFRYETEADGETPLIHVINIPETDAEIEEGNQGNHFFNKVDAARRAGLSVWNNGEIWILISESHRQQPNGSIFAGGALGASAGGGGDPGVATMTSTFLTPLAEEAITDDRPYDDMIIPEIGPYPLQQGISFASFNGPTLSSIASVTLGAFLHELTHAFGIGHHDFRNDRNFNGNLMGNGFRGIRGHLYPAKYPEDYTRIAFASALALSTNHYFNTGKQRNQVDDVTFSLVSKAPQDGKLVFDVTAFDADGLSMFHLFGIPDLSVERVLSGTKFSGQITLPYFEPSVQTDFRLKLYDKQGNKTEITINVAPQSGNRAPWPFMHFSPPIGQDGDTFVLDAGDSRDPDGNSQLTFEWDLDNDGVFDTEPDQNPLTTINLPGGNHLIRLKVTEPSGAFTVSTPMALHVAGDPPPLTEVSFTLIDASTNKAIPGFDPLSEGAELNRSSLPQQLSIRANMPANYESIRFDFNNKNSFRVENAVPYALFGDIQGDYSPGIFSLGSNTLSATPFKQNGGHGQSGPKGTIRFSVIEDLATFTLIDASTNQVIPGFDPILDGAQLDPMSLPSELSIRANVPAYYESVRFGFNGKNDFRIENVPPYALFGDTIGDYYPGQLSSGVFTLSATPFTESGAHGQTGTTANISFTVGLEILGFEYSSEIYNFEEFFPLDDGDFFDNLSAGPRPFAVPVTIKAITNPPEVGSVKLKIENEYGFTYSRIENVTPYTLFGDSNGIFNASLLSDGNYQLTATAFSEPNGKGNAGVSRTITFYIAYELEYSYPEIRIIEAESASLITNISGLEKTVIDQSVTPTDNVNFVAEYECTSPEYCPESVLFSLTGAVNKTTIESNEPFSLFGDYDSTGNFIGKSLPVGEYTLTVWGYSEDGTKGIRAGEATYDFEIINSNGLMSKAKNTVLYPNPANNTTYVKTEDNTSIFRMVILDITGKKVKEYSKSIDSEQSIDVSRLKKGLYIVQIYTGNERITKKLVVQ